MLYIIDFDSLSVESKSEDGELLASYILDNKLELAVALISSEDELLSQFSLNELQELYNNLADDHDERARKFDTEDQAAEFVWLALENNQFEFLKFSKSLGKKLIRSANKGRNDDAEDKPAKTSRLKREHRPSTGSRPTDTSMVWLGTQPKDNILPRSVWDIVDDNLGEMSIGEIVAEGGDRKQISRCIRKGFLIIQEEEL